MDPLLLESLPQEILLNITSYISLANWSSLKSLSLVNRYFNSIALEFLFSSFSVKRLHDEQQLVDILDEIPLIILKHVRHLIIEGSMRWYGFYKGKVFDGISL